MISRTESKLIAIERRNHMLRMLKRKTRSKTVPAEPATPPQRRPRH